MAKKTRKPKKQTRPAKWSFDTYSASKHRVDTDRCFREPSCFNGMVKVVRYRVTVEQIDEPEAIAERLRKLWEESDNWHHRFPLERAAKQHGVALDPDAFGKAKR